MPACKWLSNSAWIRKDSASLPTTARSDEVRDNGRPRHRPASEAHAAKASVVIHPAQHPAHGGQFVRADLADVKVVGPRPGRKMQGLLVLQISNFFQQLPFLIAKPLEGYAHAALLRGLQRFVFRRAQQGEGLDLGRI